MRALAALLLLGVTALFAWVAATPWLSAHSVGAVQAPQVEAPEEPALDLPERAPLDLSAATERPLFSAARRPPPPEAPGVVVDDPLADLLFRRYEIAGVVVLGGEARAMLRDLDGSLTRVAEGDEVPTDGAPAVVRKITLESLTFQQGDEMVVAPVRSGGAETE